MVSVGLDELNIKQSLSNCIRKTSSHQLQPVNTLNRSSRGHVLFRETVVPLQTDLHTITWHVSAVGSMWRAMTAASGTSWKTRPHPADSVGVCIQVVGADMSCLPQKETKMGIWNMFQ